MMLAAKDNIKCFLNLSDVAIQLFYTIKINISTKVSIRREKFFRVENKWLGKELLSKLLCLFRIYRLRKKKC